MGVPMRASSTGLLSPAAPRGPRFQVEGTTSWKLSIFLPLILIQCDRAPRGASTRPTPLDSSGMVHLAHRLLSLAPLSAISLIHFSMLAATMAGLDAAGGGPTQGRVQGRGRDGELGQDAVHDLFELGLTLGVGDERPGQRTDFHGLALVAGGLHPGVVVLVIELGVLRFGDALVGVFAVAAGLVPGVLDVPRRCCRDRPCPPWPDRGS